ncbi:MAG: CidA/LrgA family protein [Clostridia bacterium]|nr:CidA/LrgA family protein [Clostridia bacterium]
MKYVWQLTIILGVSFLGEALSELLPLPVPASIYGLVIMFILLLTGALKVQSIKETSDFFLVAMPILFIAPGVGVIDYWDVIKPILLPAVIIMFIATIIIMVATGGITQWVIKLNGKRGNKNA